MDVSVIIPCLNEEATVGTCIEKSLRALRESDLTGEVVVVDNGSTDRSIEISKSAGARIVHAEVKGYGSAIRAGIESAHGDAAPSCVDCAKERVLTW
jgi:glycosyltransferase involved in cell wall biosynthesis